MDTWVLSDEAGYGHVELAYLGGAGPYRYVSVGWVEFAGGDDHRHTAARWNWADGSNHWRDLDPLPSRILSVSSPPS